MPGFITHYLWGREAWQALASGPAKDNLYRNRDAYALGLQGPDLFFYDIPSHLLPGKNRGALAHTHATGKFFAGMLERAEQFPAGEKRDIALAYLAGFLGHYTLDAVCHPYIYAMTHYHGRESFYFSRHCYLEMDIDIALLDFKLHRKPRDFHHEDTIRLTAIQREVIASLLHAAYRKAFPRLHVHKSAIYRALLVMPCTLRLLHDNTGQKKVLMRSVEGLVFGHALFSPLILSDTVFFRTDPFNLRHAKWTNPWDATLTSHETFFDLYEKAMQRYLPRLTRLCDLLEDTGSLPEEMYSVRAKEKDRLRQEFLSDYGNNSFHSGLHVSIPS